MASHWVVMSTLFYVLVTLGGLLAVAGVGAWLTIYGGTLPSEVRFVLAGLIASGTVYMFVIANSGRGNSGGGKGGSGGGGD